MAKQYSQIEGNTPTGEESVRAMCLSIIVGAALVFHVLGCSVQGDIMFWNVEAVLLVLAIA